MTQRSDYFDPDDPDNMDADERRDELACIFARGVLRLHGRVRGDIVRGHSGQILEESSPTCLEVSDDLSPHRATG